jgi:localization factor PodJL
LKSWARRDGSISERLADRIDSSERRSAEAIEEVGDKIGEVAERLNQRYERAAGGLAERMRESEERLAKVLEDTAPGGRPP